MLPAFARALTPIPGVRVVAARVTLQVRVAIKLLVIALTAEAVLITTVRVVKAAVTCRPVTVAGTPVIQTVVEPVLITEAPRHVVSVIVAAIVVTVVAIMVPVLPPLHGNHALRAGQRAGACHQRCA